MSLRWTEKELEDFQTRNRQLAAIGERHGLQGAAPPKNDKRGKPNKTEMEYCTRLSFEFPHCAAKFEAVSFHMENGHTYTPDWMVRLPGGKILFVEVKARGANGFRQHSYSRAKLAFDQCRVEWPQFSWRWAEKHKGEWIIKDYLP